MSEDCLLVERRGGVLWLTLNRPALGNSLDGDLARSLLKAAVACEDDPSLRCVVLTGHGRLFCGGGDVLSFERAGAGISAMLTELTTYLHAAIARFARMEKPLVTAINGPAAGAGLGLAMLGDIALAARSAHFSVGYTAIGLSPDAATTWLLPRLVGLRRAQELAFTNRRVHADEAASMGLITRVVDDEQLLIEAETLAASLASGAVRAIGRTRALLLEGATRSLESQMEAETRAIAQGGRDPEGQEGLAAFLARRKPEFAKAP